MQRCLVWLWVLCAGIASQSPMWAQGFLDLKNDVLQRVPQTKAWEPVDILTHKSMIRYSGVLPGQSGTLLAVRGNQGRWCKLLVREARMKLTEESYLPLIRIRQFVTYRTGTEQEIHCQGQKIHLYPDFRFQIDFGQVVPQSLGGDLLVQRDPERPSRVTLHPIGDAKLYVLTERINLVAPSNPPRVTIGSSFESRYFNGTYMLENDGRRSGQLTLQVDEKGEVTGSFLSDKEGRSYKVTGSVGNPRHAIKFRIHYPQAVETFEGHLFTGNGKALAGTAVLGDRPAAFYATRLGP